MPINNSERLLTIVLFLALRIIAVSGSISDRNNETPTADGKDRTKDKRTLRAELETEKIVRLLDDNKNKFCRATYMPSAKKQPLNGRIQFGTARN